MNSVLSLGIGLLFMILQTGCLHTVVVGRYGMDLLLPLIIYLIIFRPIAESILLLVVFGFAMGTLSGASSGLYIIVYLWLFFGVRGGMGFLDAGSYFIFPLFLALGAVVENLLFAFSLSMWPSRDIWVKALCTLVTAPLFLWVFRALFDRLGRITSRWERSSQE